MPASEGESGVGMFWKNKSVIAAVIIVLAFFSGAAVYFASAQPQPDDGFEIVIGVSLWDMRDAYNLNMHRELLNCSIADDRVNIVFKDAARNPDKQRDDIAKLLDLGIDALIVRPYDPSAIQDAMQTALDSGVPVIAVSNADSVPASTVQICVDDKWLGYMAGKYVRDMAGDGELTILEIEGDMDDVAARNRRDGFRRVIGRQNSKIKVKYVVSGYWLRDKTEENILRSGILESGDDIQAVFAHDDEMAIGAYNAFRKIGKQVPIISIGGLWNEGLEAVEKGNVTATVYYSTGGNAAYGAAIATLEGVKRPEKIYMGAINIDKSNLNIAYRSSDR